MSRRLIVGLSTLLIFGTVFMPAFAGADQGLSQDWVGELKIGGSSLFAQLHLDSDREPPTGTISFPASGRTDIPLSAFSVEQGHVTFSWAEDSGQTRFVGRITDGLLEGIVRTAAQQGTLQLTPTATLPADAQQEFVGYYEMQPGHLLSITTHTMGKFYVDYTTGRLGVLFPSSTDKLFAGPAFQVPVPIAIRCHLSTDPVTHQTTLHWQDKAGEQVGRKLALRREDVTFKSGDVVLSGTLVLPVGHGPHPAIVRIHGSGPQTRRNSVDGWYAYHGVAHLSFDKRGAGKSTGDWHEAGISELASDVLAAVRFLRQRGDIDPVQIGIEAVSEGGWIAPVVAAQDSRIKFMVIMSGPAMDYVPELMNEVEERVKARGLNGNDLTKALDFKRKALEMIAEGAGLSDDAWAKFQAFVDPYRNEKWFSYVSEPRERGPGQKKLYLMSRVRSSEFWRRVKIPVLAFYGGKDLNVPATKNVAALTQELDDAGNQDYMIKVFPDANHEGIEASSAMLDNEQVRYLQRQVPGFFDTLLRWMLSHLANAEPTQQPR